VTIIHEAEYIGLALATKQEICLTNTLKELNIPVTTALIFCDKAATIDIPYNPKIGDQSKYIDVAYNLVYKNIESGQISLLQIESNENLANDYIKGVPQLTLWILRTAIMSAKYRRMLDFGRYFIILLFYYGYLFHLS
jgi:hypothetical protein